MEYKAIKSNFGGQPLAGYFMDIRDMTIGKDGCDSISFLDKVRDYCSAIEEMSDTDEHKMYEFFFTTATDESTFTFDFYVGYTVAELKEKDYVDGWEWNDIHYYRMYTMDEDWGLDEIELCCDPIHVAEINIPKEPSDIFNDDMNGELKYKCPNCGYEFKVAQRCPECGQSIRIMEDNNMEYEVMETITSECYSDFYDKWFDITKDMGRSENRIMFLNNLLKAEDSEQNFSYVGFKYEDINDVIELSDFIISYEEDDVKGMALIYRNEFNSDTGIHLIKRIQFEEKEYDLYKVTGSRLRTVEETFEFLVAIPKGSDKSMAENFVENEYDENSDLEWEVVDKEYEVREFCIKESEEDSYGTKEEIEEYNDDVHFIEE